MSHPRGQKPKPKKHPKCKLVHWTSVWGGEYDCEYGSTLTCHECKYGEHGGTKDPKAKCNQE